MRASQLRLLPVYAAIVAGAAIMPMSAIAAPAAPAPVVHLAPAPHQVVSEDRGTAPTPPLWLLLLLAPVLIGGVVGVGITLRRLR
jgi:hypothetical protein